jgi:uridine kinase
MSKEKYKKVVTVTVKGETGIGKTTVANIIVDALKAKGITFVLNDAPDYPGRLTEEEQVVRAKAMREKGVYTAVIVRQDVG